MSYKLTQVIPMNDSQKHDLNKDLSCWCDPEILEESKGKTAVHHSSVPRFAGDGIIIEKFASIDGSEFMKFVDDIHLSKEQLDLYAKFMERKKKIESGEIDA